MVAPLAEVLHQLEREEKEDQRWVAAPGEPFLYRVIHKRVAIRAWRSTSAPTLGQRKLGEVVQAVEVHGLWARLHPDECAAATVVAPRSELPRLIDVAEHEGRRLGGGIAVDGEGQRGWILIDGAEVGLGKLLELVPGAPAPGAEKPVPTRPLNAQEFEILRAVSLGMMDLGDLDDDFRSHPEVVRAAVKRDGLALEHAAPELRADRETVLAAWRQNARALQFASEELREELKFAREARGGYLAAGRAAPRPPNWLASLEASRGGQRAN